MHTSIFDYGQYDWAYFKQSVGSSYLNTISFSSPKLEGAVHVTDLLYLRELSLWPHASLPIELAARLRVWWWNNIVV